MYTMTVPMNKGTLEYVMIKTSSDRVLNVLYVGTVDKINGYHRS